MSQKKGHWYRTLGDSLPRRRPVSGITGVLTNAFRSILIDLGVNSYQYNALMEQYLQHEVDALEKKRRDRELRRKPDPNAPPLNHVELNRRDRTTTRGNLNKEFGRESMTWKVFCKALTFLQVTRFRLIVVVERKNGMVTEHSTPLVTLDPDAVIEDFANEDQKLRPLGSQATPLTLTKSSITIPEDPTTPEGQ